MREGVVGQSLELAIVALGRGLALQIVDIIVIENSKGEDSLGSVLGDRIQADSQELPEGWDGWVAGAHPSREVVHTRNVHNRDPLMAM